MKFAICNELYENWPFEKVCDSVASLGYTGLEVAPFTLAPLITDVSDETRKTLRRQAERAGTPVIGLHWLLAKTTGFHLNAREAQIREKTADYLNELIRACADLGGELMVFGSPAARKIPEGATLNEAMQLAADTIARTTKTLEQCNVRLCLEPLTAAETDFLQTADEGAELMRRVGHPNVVLHLDVKAMSSETTPIPAIIAAHAAHTGHFHANDPNMRGPGMGKVDFVPIFQALREVGYDQWVSVEVFDFKPDPVTIARESIDYMKACLSKLK